MPAPLFGFDKARGCEFISTLRCGPIIEAPEGGEITDKRPVAHFCRLGQSVHAPGYAHVSLEIDLIGTVRTVENLETAARWLESKMDGFKIL